MNEIWKDVKGFEGLYQVSNLGRVKSLYRKEHILKGLKYNGYVSVQLCKNHKIVSQPKIHDLVVETFVRPFNRQTEECHHKNHIRDDNRLQNLQILSIKDHHCDPVTRQKISTSKLGHKLDCEKDPFTGRFIKLNK